MHVSIPQFRVNLIPHSNYIYISTKCWEFIGANHAYTGKPYDYMFLHLFHMHSYQPWPALIPAVGQLPLIFTGIFLLFQNVNSFRDRSMKGKNWKQNKTRIFVFAVLKKVSACVCLGVCMCVRMCMCVCPFVTEGMFLMFLPSDSWHTFHLSSCFLLKCSRV